MECIIIILALAGIVYGAENLVSGSVAVARRYKVSDFVIGAAIVGIGTSMPELTVSFIGAVEGNSEVAIGNVIGSNIFNILGILGITALFFPITVTKANLRFEIPVCIFVSILLTLLTFNTLTDASGILNRADGWILLITFALFMWYSFYSDRRNQKDDSKSKIADIVTRTPVWQAMIKIIGGLGLLIFSCDIFVDNAVLIARNLGLNDAFISITLIACGTSLPELAASIMAAVKKNTQLALGNILGSNIFNICLILGLSAQVTPLSSPDIPLTDYIVMIVAAFSPLIFGFKGKIGRLSGIVMVIMFIAYTWYLLYQQLP